MGVLLKGVGLLSRGLGLGLMQGRFRADPGKNSIAVSVTLVSFLWVSLQ